MIEQIPASRKAIAWNGAFAILVSTQMWFVSMAVHAVGFPLMAQQAGS